MATSGKRKQRNRTAKRGGAWRWLGFGALGLGAVATLLLRGRSAPRPKPRRPKSKPRSTEKPSLDLAAEVDVFFISAPSGGLRIAERAPAGDEEASLTILFVHGLGGRLEQWAPQLSERVERVRILAFDLPGHGESDPPMDGELSMNSLVQAVGAVMENLAIRRAVLVGHSLGASVVTAYAASHPDRVAGVLLVDPNGDSTRIPEDQRQNFLKAVRQDPHGELIDYYRQILLGSSSEVERRVLTSLESTPSDVLVAGVQILMSYSPLADLEAYTGHFLALYSESNDVPHSLHRLLPDLPARWIPGTGHWLMLDDSMTFAEVLETFLNEFLDRNPTA